MQIGLGVLRWRPGAFWQATPHELIAGLEGYQLSHGAGNDDSKKSEDFETWAADVARAEELRDRRAARERILNGKRS